ncbi:PQQ-binding-like beta-propeller repeat protein [Myceligenerans crystallogenes]|uniref:Pyrrolo-quinoline quinone repeat domain-containing protein n=1 Tax=Myceligenerans crystallogenes TaxID=316335 RepID=A0ABN2NEZ4_9MICO
MSRPEDDSHDESGVLLDSVPEHIKNPSGDVPGPADPADDDAAGDGRSNRARRGPVAGAALLGPGLRRSAAASAGGLRKAGGALRSMVPGSVTGRAILAGGVAVVVAGAVVGTTVVQANQRDARLRAAPGGVLTLAEAPREAWHVDLGDAVEPRVVPVGDLAAVTAGGRVLGLDPETGEQRWAVEVLGKAAVSQGATVRCGSSPQPVGSIAVRTPAPSDPLVCVTEGGGTTEAIVIGADGAVERRELKTAGDDAAGLPAPVLAPLPDGGIAVLTRDDTPVDLGEARVVEDGSTASVKGNVRSAPGLTVRVEDAATGEPRWERTVEFDAGAQANSCIMWTPEGPELDVTGELTWSANGELISADSCGISARLATSDGAPQPVADGEPTATPWATADPDLDPALVPRIEDATGVLAQTAGTAVLLTAKGEIVAYDVRSGDRRWTADVLGKDAATVAGSSAFGAYTDGRSVMLVLDGRATGGDGPLRLVALDLATGETTWDISQDQPYYQVAAIDGHLVQINGTGVSGLATAS